MQFNAVDNKVMGQRLKSFRSETGMTQKEFAASLGLRLSTYQKYEEGVRRPSDDIKVLLADRFGVSVQHLFFSI